MEDLEFPRFLTSSHQIIGLPRSHAARLYAAVQPLPSSMSQPIDSPHSPAVRRVNKSCLECSKRKVKCDGFQPCSSCVYYRTTCGYRERSRRNAVSRR